MAEPRHILIVDDSETDRLTLKRHLQKDREYACTFSEAETIADALEQIQTGSFDCVLLDFMLPDGTGLDFIETVRDRYGRLRLPIVIQTGTGSQADAVKLMKAGAHDYLVKKEIVGESLRIAVRGAIYRVESERVIEAQQAELRESLRAVQAARDAAESAQKEAERANAAKDEFLAMLSHELRTPLTPVLSVVSATLAEENLSRDMRETFDLIRRNVQVEARLIDDLLDLTKILNGSFTVGKGTVDLRACWQAAFDLGTPLLRARGITVESSIAPDCPLIQGDFSRLQQLFWIILKNATEFTTEGGRIEVVITRSPSTVEVAIRDWGEGIPTEKLAGIFDVFQRPGGSNRFGTLGIGLSIAQAIAKAHGGSLSAGSDGVGHGACFTITLPVAEEIPTGSSNDALARTGVTVLVVDDHEDTRRVLSRALRRRGFLVSMAGTAAEAKQSFSDHPAELIICDIGLPDANGWDVVRDLRRSFQFKAIAVTGYGMDSDIEKSISAGYDAHITKPIEFPHLTKLIDELVGSR